MGEEIMKHSASKNRHQIKCYSFQKDKNCMSKISFKKGQKLDQKLCNIPRYV